MIDRALTFRRLGARFAIFGAGISVPGLAGMGLVGGRHVDALACAVLAAIGVSLAATTAFVIEVHASRRPASIKRDATAALLAGVATMAILAATMVEASYLLAFFERRSFAESVVVAAEAASDFSTRAVSILLLLWPYAAVLSALVLARLRSRGRFRLLATFAGAVLLGAPAVLGSCIRGGRSEALALGVVFIVSAVALPIMAELADIAERALSGPENKVEAGGSDLLG